MNNYIDISTTTLIKIAKKLKKLETTIKNIGDKVILWDEKKERKKEKLKLC